MKSNLLFFLVLFIATFSSCKKGANAQNTQGATDTIPKGAIKLQYEEGKCRFDGTINDSIKLSMIWDTGLADDVIIVNDSLLNLYGDSAIVRVGKFEKKLKVIYFNSKETFQALGSKTAFIGKDFFKGKIIEVSLFHNYIKEVENLDAMKSDYIKIKIKKALHLNMNTTVYVQGKSIDAYVFIDTGNPGNLILNYQMGVDGGLDMKNTVPSNAIIGGTGKVSEHCIITMDSIRLNDTYTVTKTNRIVFMKYPNAAAMIGMLGCGLLDDFTFILDQVNYDLYLKPLDCDIKQ